MAIVSWMWQRSCIHCTHKSLREKNDKRKSKNKIEIHYSEEPEEQKEMHFCSRKWKQTYYGDKISES